jgi:hypothetical protein
MWCTHNHGTSGDELDKHGGSALMADGKLMPKEEFAFVVQYIKIRILTIP